MFIFLIWFIRDPIYKYFSGCFKANPDNPIPRSGFRIESYSIKCCKTLEHKFKAKPRAGEAVYKPHETRYNHCTALLNALIKGLLNNIECSCSAL